LLTTSDVSIVSFEFKPQKIPPPLETAWFWPIVEPTSDSAPCVLAIAPPYAAELSLIVHPTSASAMPPRTRIAPPQKLCSSSHGSSAPESGGGDGGARGNGGGEFGGGAGGRSGDGGGAKGGGGSAGGGWCAGIVRWLASEQASRLASHRVLGPSESVKALVLPQHSYVSQVLRSGALGGLLRGSDVHNKNEGVGGGDPQLTTT